jgi:hypothetical protein
MEESMAKRGRPPKHGGTVYKRNDSDIWQVRYKDQKGEMIRESAATTDREQAERFLRDRLDARDEGRLSVLLGSKRLTFNEWADWFLEKRSKPTVSECWQSRGEPECPEISQTGIRRDGLIGYHFRRGRKLSDGSASSAPQNTNQTRNQIGRRYQTGNGASGTSGFDAYSERRGEAEAAGRQPMCGGRVSGLGTEVNEKTALYDGERTAENRVRGSELSAEYRCHRFRARVALQEGASSDEEGASRSGKPPRTYLGFEDINRDRRHAFDQCGTGGIPASDGGDARQRVSVSQPHNDREESGRNVFCRPTSFGTPSQPGSAREASPITW